MTKGRNPESRSQPLFLFSRRSAFFVALDGNGLAAGLVVVVGGQEVHPRNIDPLVGLWPSGCGVVEERSIRLIRLLHFRLNTYAGRDPYDHTIVPKTK